MNTQMNSESSPFAFEPFPSVPGQHAAEWSSRLALITSLALNAPTGQEGGLIGFILDAPTYLADYGHAFVPFAHPGNIPNANAAVGAWKVYESSMQNWLRESSAIKNLMSNIFKSLDRVALAWFFDPARNRYNMDPQNFFVIMLREYGLADTEVVTRWVTSLQTPMPPDSNVRDLVASHRDLHTKLNIARGYVIHHDEAVRGLLQATRFSPLRPAIITWLTEHRGALNQTFDALAEHLCHIELVTESLSAPTTGPMYTGLQANLISNVSLQANAVANVPTVSNADILQAIQSLVLSTRSPRPKNVSKTGSVSHIHGASTISYCWTHGHCGHSPPPAENRPSRRPFWYG
jgi:hypothetical protein